MPKRMRDDAADYSLATGRGTVEGGEYLTDRQFAESLHVTTRTTARWRDDGGGPSYTRVGPRLILYRRRDIDTWLASRTFPHRAAESVAA